MSELPIWEMRLWKEEEVMTDQSRDAEVEAARQEERLKLACEIDDLLKVKWDNIRAMEIAETVLFYLREQGWMNPLEITAQHSRHVRTDTASIPDYITKLEEENANLTARLASAEGERDVARDIGDTFWVALKPLKLRHINVSNPGQHVTDLIAEREALSTKFYDAMEILSRWSNLDKAEAIGRAMEAERERDALKAEREELRQGLANEQETVRDLKAAVK